jgi:hypothetical protein
MMCEMPLHYSVKARDISFINMLVDFGANVYATDNHGLLPSGYAPDNHPVHSLLQQYEGKHINNLKEIYISHISSA